MSFPNVYTHRKVADTAAKGCEICFKASTSVLVASENKVSYLIFEHVVAILMTAKLNFVRSKANS